MKELVEFSLRRRFYNKSQIILNVIMFVVIGCGLFADSIIEMINPRMLDLPIVYIKNLDRYTEKYLLKEKQEIFQFKEWKDEKIEESGEYLLEFDDNFVIHSLYQLDTMDEQSLNYLLNQAHQSAILEEAKDNVVLFEFAKPIELKNKVLEKSIDVSQEKQQIVFMVITGIYFMMLSFATSAATEVVYEKSTKTLELILTSVNAKVHFLSKMIVGWFVIVIQCGLTLSYGLFWFLIRNMNDGGFGLIQAINKMRLFSIKEKTFKALLSNLDIELDFVGKLVMIFLFLFIGILLIQLILVIVSSFVSNIEEAGNIQAPFYLILLGVYYLTLSLNSPYHMQEGIGFYFSFVPFLSMLFMPCRLLLCDVGWSELILSFVISLSTIILVMKSGSKIYQRGVLDYSNKGILHILKSILNPMKEKSRDSKPG